MNKKEQFIVNKFTNEKGQALVLFTLMFPVIIIILIVTINVINISNEKNKLNQITYDTTKFILDYQNDASILEKANELLNKNTNDTTYNIQINDEYVVIETQKTLNYTILNIDLNIKTKYKGNLQTKRIEKE